MVARFCTHCYEPKHRHIVRHKIIGLINLMHLLRSGIYYNLTVCCNMCQKPDVRAGNKMGMADSTHLGPGMGMVNQPSRSQLQPPFEVPSKHCSLFIIRPHQMSLHV